MQRRTLHRAASLTSFRRVLVELATAGDALATRRRAVIVPTRAAAELLRQTLEADAIGPGRPAVILPDLLTRDEWQARLQAALPAAPPMLTRFEREVLLARAARAAGARFGLDGPPFHLRPGLVAAMLDLYDELRRRQRTVRRFARALFDQLRVERGTDRGSESLIRQTVFLGAAFLAYERAVDTSGGLDEHQLRARLLAAQPDPPYDHVVIGVADHPTDPRGLWPADFDLIGRLTGLAQVDVVLTEESHDAGFRERLEFELPGIVETARRDDEPPGMLVRSGGDDGDICFVSRDREEELRDVARLIIARAGARGDELAGPTAIVFHRPLPYLYLAQQVLADARVPYQAFDALPLAAEPYAALLDQVVAVARTSGVREAAIALLRSTLMTFDVGGTPVSAHDASALDAVLRERRANGEAATFAAEVDGWFGSRDSRQGVSREAAARAATAAAAATAALAPFREGATASAQVDAVASFLRHHERAPAGRDARAERHRRARAAVLGVLDGLGTACRRHDDAPRPTEDITSAIRHGVEARTFAPRRGQGGVHLVDAVAARFGAFDHAHLVGLVETDWPERCRRSIFYTSGLLAALSWPQDVDQARAQLAAFRDLLGLGSRTTTLHAFQLDGDAVVAASPVLDVAADRPAGREPPTPPVRVFADEVLTTDAEVTGLDPEAAAWLARRRARPALDDLRYAGRVLPQAPQAYRISRVDRYADCPFKYFATSVLNLPEERDEASGLTPLERGTLLHELFERFHRAWQADGRGAITAATLPEAIARFSALTREALASLPAADRVLEETRLLGSIVGRGVAERVFELEVEAGRPVVDRHLEFELQGPFAFPLLNGLRHVRIAVRGKADRIDVYDDGSIGVVDYKLGRVPDDHSVQVAVYAHCARTLLAGPDGAPRRVRSAAYLAFGDEQRLEGALGRGGQSVEMAVEERASQFAAHVQQIEAGEFPARPRRVGDCQWCAYAGVCRKEYRAEDDDAAELV
jgi:RecB family exonuclease